MVEFQSHYKQLGFYVNGEHHKFNDGRFVTEDEATIEVLTNIPDAVRVAEAKAEPKKAEEKPAAKAKAPAKKASGK